MQCSNRLQFEGPLHLKGLVKKLPSARTLANMANMTHYGRAKGLRIVFLDHTSIFLSLVYGFGGIKLEWVNG